MKYIIFLTIFIPALLPANVTPQLLINEIYIPENDMWSIELRATFRDSLDSIYLKTKSDSAFFSKDFFQFYHNGIKLADTSSLRNSIEIDRNGDYIAIRYGYPPGGLIAAMHFGPGEEYKAPDSGQSLCLDSYSQYAEYYLDNSPTLGEKNDASGARCTIYGYVKDTLDNPFKSLAICLNRFVTPAPCDYCRDTAFTNTEGFFEFHSLAYAFPSNLRAWTGSSCNNFTKLIEDLDLSPDSTYDLGTLIIRGLSSVPEDQTDFNRFSLFQNHPNPFTGETKIVFTLPETLPTLLEVYNPEGQKVKTLVKGTIPSGKHEITFDATELSSGVYIYKLRAGRHYSDSKKLIITK